MNKILGSLAITGCFVGMLFLTPSQVTAKKTPIVKFYCGQSFDPSSNKIIPTTIVATSARKETVSIIQWKSTEFGKYTPQNRCASVSDKLQVAWEGKRLKYLVAGTSKRTGQGIICGVKDRSNKCDESSMLFTLSNGADAKEIIDRIKDIQMGKKNIPVSQSSGEGVVDIEELVEKLNES